MTSHGYRRLGVTMMEMLHVRMDIFVATSRVAVLPLLVGIGSAFANAHTPFLSRYFAIRLATCVRSSSNTYAAAFRAAIRLDDR